MKKAKNKMRFTVLRVVEVGVRVPEEGLGEVAARKEEEEGMVAVHRREKSMEKRSAVRKVWSIMTRERGQAYRRITIHRRGFAISQKHRQL